MVSSICGLTGISIVLAPVSEPSVADERSAKSEWGLPESVAGFECRLLRPEKCLSLADEAGGTRRVPATFFGRALLDFSVAIR